MSNRPASHDEMHLIHIQECLDLAVKARGDTGSNPLVGAVLVTNGEVIGRGYHRRSGDPHAEQVALAQAGNAARGATLYTNVEPCCHQGRTPPCVEAIIAAGVRAVVASHGDPDERVDGRGFEGAAGRWSGGLDWALGDRGCRAQRRLPEAQAHR